MGIKSVSDTGPIMHLSEIHVIGLLDMFTPVAIGPAVETELKYYKIQIPEFISIISLNKNAKDLAAILALEYELELGEAESIALVRSESANLFFTDDLDARDTAKALGIEVHGTIGILIRAFRNKKITKIQAIKKLREIKSSSLFITSELIERAVRAVEGYRL